MYADCQHVCELRLSVSMRIRAQSRKTREGGSRCFVRLWLLALAVVNLSAWADETFERVTIVDPFLELRTGPGRGYPITYIAERGEAVEILMRRTDWFKVRSARGKEGWASREQMERTLAQAGVPTTFRDVLLQDYLRRRLEFGFSFGRFESDAALTARVGYRWHENVLLEFALSQVPGNFSSTSLMYGSVVSQPYPDLRWSPFFALGMGRFNNKPKATLVSAIETDADLANAGLGLRYYLTRRFVARFEFRQHVALINSDRTDTFKEWSLGISSFF